MINYTLNYSGKLRLSFVIFTPNKMTIQMSNDKFCQFKTHSHMQISLTNGRKWVFICMGDERVVESVHTIEYSICRQQSDKCRSPQEIHANFQIFVYFFFQIRIFCYYSLFIVLRMLMSYKRTHEKNIREAVN